MELRDISVFNQRVLDKYQSELEKARIAIEKRDLLLEKWNKEEQSVILPAGKWSERDRLVPLFSNFSYIILFLSIITIIPAFFVLPIAIRRYSKRNKLKKKILTQQRIINGTLPIPLPKTEFEKIETTYWGERLIVNNIVFKKTPQEMHSHVF